MKTEDKIIQKKPSPAARDPRLEKLLMKMSRKNADIRKTEVREAYRFLRETIAHEKGKDQSFDVEAPLETAEILADLTTDEEAIIAALLYHLVKSKRTTLEEIRERFSPDVATLVQGVTRTSRVKFKSRLEEQAENFRKMLLAMARDLRVVMLNLAKRLQVMRNIEKFDPETQQEIATETIEIYAPLAHRLGIALIKWELEDLCLKVLHPAAYHELEERVPQNLQERNAYIRKVIHFIRREMKAQGLPGTVVGRSKHFYSIYQKIVKRGVSFEDIFDLAALRIITHKPSQCYAILGLIHSLWKPVPGRFKDYIGVPKTNMYQSLHTTVIGPDGQKVEFQIRTEEMHRVAEEGIAAHWKYKEGGRDKNAVSSLDRKLAWLRQLLEWQKEVKNPREFMENVKTDLFEDTVYVFTPEGEIKELPRGATPLDFAYSIHSDVGNRCTGARIDTRMVPLKTPLKTGNTVEILTSKNQVPSKDWLKMVKTTKAKTRIRHFLKQEEHKRSLSLGNEILDKTARKHGLTLTRMLKSDEMQKVVEEYGFAQPEKLIAAVGYGKISAQQVLARFLPREEEPQPEAAVKPRKPAGKSKDGIKIRGIGDILVHFSRCCNPVPGDEIIGFITQGQGVSIHTTECTNVTGGTLNPERIVDVDWDVREEIARSVRISVITNNQPGVLTNISARISTENINISEVNVRTRKDGRAICRFVLEIKNRKDLDHILHAISEIRDVLEVKRVMRA
ncbi:MAG: bifunctional (p)ppGpp synthetase/guanosine-3',5'-bis(diphosphate) 3'-pyrophosphohydrolase [Deltaproteobacteria bacterium]|nr:bifunctional (p)ppGpp synthetase/guanosine-3',5'-bis(diphosphate) 3'-pyrophosphohydrolase [Deltaproteobacteria bacterium]